MTDDVDLASQNEEAYRQYLIANHREKQLPLNGLCYNCHEPIKKNFCSKECREDWEKRKYFNSQKKTE